MPMRIRKPLLLVCAGLGATLLLLQSCTIALPISGRVVDERTGMPLQGVHVLALWETARPSLIGWRPGPLLRLQKAVTDAQGRYRLAPWLRLHRPLAPFSLYVRYRHDSPRLHFFVAGYRPKGVSSADITGAGPKRPGGLLSLRWMPATGPVRLEPAPPASNREASEEFRLQIDVVQHLVSDAIRGQRDRRDCADGISMLKEIDAVAASRGFDTYLHEGHPLSESCQ